MPTLLSLEALEADRIFVQRQRDETPENRWGTARIMWENRLRDIEERIAALGAARSNYASVAVIFDGLPVIGQGDIRLDFSTEALNSYQKMVSAALAAGRGEEIPERGPLPGAEKSRLFIRDIVRGSMGFILEEIAPDQHEIVPTPLKQAVESSTKLIEGLSSASEEDFENTIEDAAPRLVSAVQKFAQVLHDAGASTRILGDENRVALTVVEVSRLSDRLNEVEISEETEQIFGTLLGILPDSQQFELRLPVQGQPTMKGSVADDLALKYLADADFKERLLLKPVRTQIKHVRTLRNGRLVREQRILENLEPVAETGQLPVGRDGE